MHPEGEPPKPAIVLDLRDRWRVQVGKDSPGGLTTDEGRELHECQGLRSRAQRQEGCDANPRSPLCVLGHSNQVIADVTTESRAAYADTVSIALTRDLSSRGPLRSIILASVVGAWGSVEA